MLFNNFENDKPYLLEKFRNPTFDESTGLDNETIKADVARMADEMADLPRPILKARLFEYIAQNVQIDVNPHDWFVGFACWNRNDRILGSLIWDSWRHNAYKKCETKPLMEKLIESGSAAIWADFDHSVPDWDVVFELGFPGLLERAKQYRNAKEAEGTLTDQARAYYDAIDITYSAILEMLQRFHSYAIANAKGNKRTLAVADCIKNLIYGAPQNTFEVLSLIYIYFILCEHIDHMQVRSLSNLDRTLYPYFKRDLEDGTFTEPQLREFIDYFLMQYGSINNYWGHPFYIGGTGKDGESLINELSYIILEEFEKLDITSPKIQLKINNNTPEKFLNLALDMVRRNNSSLVFISEQAIMRAMMGVGFSAEEARTCDINGCYEYNVKAREVKTGPIYLSLLKPIELVFNNGFDPVSKNQLGYQTGEIDSLATFDDFYKAYIKQLDFIIDSCCNCADSFEQYLQEINPANVFSATIENSLKTAKDAFANGSVYNNTVVLHTGLATAADALIAIKRFVFEKNELTLAELKEVLANDWQGHEKLQLKILNSNDKFGNNLSEVDNLVEAIARFCSNKINLRPNARGGFYKAAMHSARTFITMGELTGATPDGRKKGEEMSKNISPTMGMDINGITALLNSVAKIDSAMFPEDYALDMMLHPATVQGEDGLAAMRNLMKTYMARHGASIHFNVFDADTLRAAQKNPEQYEGLQVRVCGWNVRFNDICKKEQDEYIKRAENISE